MTGALTFAPTLEQTAAVELALSGGSLAIEALAGAGKTSTLKLIAGAVPGRGRYIAFNKKIVEDARGAFPSQVECSTAHSLAYRSCGARFGMAKGRRMTASDMASVLGIDYPMVFGDAEETIEVGPAALASLARRTVDAFCMSADYEIGERHVPFVTGLDAPGKWANNRALARRVAPLADRIWEDMKQPGRGDFAMGFNYLKLWHLEGPVIDADYILFDEAQDANPLMMAIVEAQDCQKIWVGDTQQQIYGWNGAVNALATVDVSARTWLTESFRFGPEIASAANLVLRRLDAPEMVKGSGPAGRVGPVDAPDVLLGRTNAAVVTAALELMDDGRRVCVQGGTTEIVWFAEAAEKLQAGRRVDHPELACFASWDAVLRYVEAEELGAELKLNVGLVERFGARTIVEGLSAAVPAARADVTVSTAHKSKGAEWNRVRLLGDFPAGASVGEEELRLIYVAATRAKRELDATLVDLAGITVPPALREVAADAAVQLVPLPLGPTFEPSGGVGRIDLTARRITARERTVSEARDELGGDVLREACSYCLAFPHDPCTIRRGPRTGQPTDVAHTPRVVAAAALVGLSVDPLSV